ncbi:hypothetical protein L3Q72_17010 [Vibrio sp. JC009]|uniref:tight adherence pilus pseudopilin TadF n=1 Tax=Vibrio sp. JC009 TaxID=2912314 RepID=UPI0023AF19E1|nr:tight adherence pilus pseudopilin TadF [Vibrio sp. JC009]WED24574.1 hypothetical protein L3Q72_17010 [Vibrio sp. JC009]
MGKRKQKGVFIIELSIILVFLSALCAMQINIMIATSKKGQMERLAYSLVGILSEREEFFRDKGNMCESPTFCTILADELYDIAIKSMERMSSSFDSSDFGFQIEEYIKSEHENKYSVRRRGATSGCNFYTIDGVDTIIPQTAKGTNLPIYQVSLCYATPFNLIGISNGQFTHITASAFSYARY